VDEDKRIGLIVERVLEAMGWDKETRAAIEDTENIMYLAVEAKALVDIIYAQTNEARLLRASECLDKLQKHYRDLRTVLPGGRLHEFMRTLPCVQQGRSGCPLADMREDQTQGEESDVAQSL